MTETRWAAIQRGLKRTGALQFLLGLLSLTGYMLINLVTDFALPRWWMPVPGWLGVVLLGTGGVSLLAVYSFRNHALRAALFGCVVVLQASAAAWIVLLIGNGLRVGWAWQDVSIIPIVLSVASGMLIIAALALSLETTSVGLQTAQRGIAGSLALVVIAFLATILFQWPDWLFSILTIWAAISLVGVAVLPAAIRRAERPRGGVVRTLSRRLRLTHTCPGCSEWIESRPGPARCDWCGLRMLIDVAEPRCTCGYLLYELQGESCPECGRRIEDASAAAATPA